MATTEVYLHIYDVANTESVKTNNAIVQLNKIFKDGMGLGGIFHSAIEVYGKLEWSFGYCETASGVFSCPRTENPMYVYRETLPLGHTELSAGKVRELLIKLSQEWQGSSYDLLARNCNHFCNDFCNQLGVQKLPGWVNRFANAGETAFDVAETTMTRLRQAKVEVVSACKVAYGAVFGNTATSVVTSSSSQLEGPSIGSGNVLRLPFLNTPVSLFGKLGIGSRNQSSNNRIQEDESIEPGKRSIDEKTSQNHTIAHETDSIEMGTKPDDEKSSENTKPV